MKTGNTEQSPRLNELEKYVPKWCDLSLVNDVRQELAQALLENPRIRNNALRKLAENVSSKFTKSMEVGLTVISDEGEEYDRELPSSEVMPQRRPATRRSNGHRRHGRLAAVPTRKFLHFSELFHEGKISLKQIAVQLGFRPGSGDTFVANEFARRRIILRRRPKIKEVTPGAIALMATLYKKGLSIASISEQIGISRQTIGKYLKASGIAMRPVGAHGATRCRRDGCNRPVYKQTRTYFDKRISRNVTTTFGSTCRFHYSEECGSRSRKHYDKNHVRVKGLETCPKGHEYSESNTYWWNGSRSCRICQREASRRYYKRKRERVINF